METDTESISRLDIHFFTHNGIGEFQSLLAWYDHGDDGVWNKNDVRYLSYSSPPSNRRYYMVST